MCLVPEDMNQWGRCYSEQGLFVVVILAGAFSPQRDRDVLVDAGVRILLLLGLVFHGGQAGQLLCVGLELPVVDPPLSAIPKSGLLGLGGEQVIVLELVEQVAVGGLEGIVYDTVREAEEAECCLLYTSDAADE